MVKSKSTKLTALLLALVLVTSCFVGGTLARYVTSTSSEDSARVAVWGINADEVTMDLFDATYTINGVTVAQSEDGDNIIAPGTEKDNYFSIVNLDDNLKPEVMYEVAINLDDSEIDPLILNNPSIQWRLDEGTYGTWEETKAQVLALSGDASGVKTYAPLEIASEFTADKTHTIGWRWIMDNNNNEMDTQMGNKAVNGDLTAKISIKVTATQVNVDTTGMLDGNGQVYDINNPTPLVFRSAAPVDELQSVEVDGEEITQGTDYTVSSGSTVITLSDTYLASLETGNYTISIISDSMTARATFAVASIEDTANTPIAHNGIIPVGGTYYQGVEPDKVTVDEYTGIPYKEYYISNNIVANTVYNAGEEFPTEIQDGDIYIFDDYIYKYNFEAAGVSEWIENTNINGWGVGIIDKTKTEYGNILGIINNKNVTSISETFAYTNITVSPTIPTTVNFMNRAYAFSSLSNAPTIPKSIVDMSGAYAYSSVENNIIVPTWVTKIDNICEMCPAETIEINSQNIESYTDALFYSNVTKITGTCPENIKEAILATNNTL